MENSHLFPTIQKRFAPEKAKDMVLTAVSQYRDTGIRLGVSRRYLIKLIENHDLSQSDVDALVGARMKHKASFPKMVKLMSKGFVPEDVYLLYEARAEINAVLSGFPEKSTVSLSALAQFSLIFAEASLDEDVDSLSDLAAEVCHEINSRVWWVRYPDQALKLACDMAEAGQFCDVQTVLDAIDQRAPRSRWCSNYGFGAAQSGVYVAPSIPSAPFTFPREESQNSEPDKERFSYVRTPHLVRKLAIRKI